MEKPSKKSEKKLQDIAEKDTLKWSGNMMKYIVASKSVWNLIICFNE
jgi:hypothetical protein